MKKILVVIAGPTASGKTELAVNLALHYHTEIVSSDSRQFYREMNIGTAKPSAQQLAQVPHHFISHLSIIDQYSAGSFEHDCIQLLHSLFEKYNIIIMVGGSGLFTRAVLEGFDAFPEITAAAEARVKELYEKQGIAGLQTMLKELDPQYYRQVDRQNPARLMRALSVCLSGKENYSSLLKAAGKERFFTPVKIGLSISREALYARINQRVDDMIKAGLLEEVRSLLKYESYQALQTVGYSELFLFLQGNISFNEAVNKIKQHTRNYAKRQLTWYRKEKDITWFSHTDVSGMTNHIDSMIAGSKNEA